MSANWTKSWDLVASSGKRFDIFEKDDDGLVHARCDYFEPGTMFHAPPLQNGDAKELKQKIVSGSDSDDAYNKIIEWARAEFGDDTIERSDS